MPPGSRCLEPCSELDARDGGIRLAVSLRAPRRPRRRDPALDRVGAGRLGDSSRAVLALPVARRGVTVLHALVAASIALTLSPREKAALVVVSGLPAPRGVAGVIVRRWDRAVPRPAGALVFADQEGGAIRTFPQAASVEGCPGGPQEERGVPVGSSDGNRAASERRAGRPRTGSRPCGRSPRAARVPLAVLRRCVRTRSRGRPGGCVRQALSGTRAPAVLHRRQALRARAPA